ncbi:MFS transporter [Agromyces aureus]|uniref:MFS transporter n=1 Tax=Agromyces aureus TaxID=453304 RepID=A0A191WFS0_9MICO|nr:MFS transporter [Agromyces aureus]ANJ27135.1 MFS transporter [Agromyces aureus]
MGDTSIASPPVTATRRAGVWQAILLLAGSCMPVLGSVLITPILPQLSEHFGAIAGAEVLVPMIVAIPALMIALFAPFAGQIVDRLGRKPLLVTAMIAYALVGTAPAWLEALPAILVSRVLVGICEAAIMTVCTTLIVDYFHEKRRRDRYLGLQTVVTTLAATAFIVLGGALGVGGWHTPFWVYAISLVVAAFMIVSLWEPTPAEAGEVAPAASGAVASDSVNVAAKVKVPWARIGVPLLVTLFGGLTFYLLVLEMSYLVVGTGIAATDTAAIGGVAAAASLATAIGGLSFAALSRRLRHGVLIPVAFGMQAVGMVVIWMVPGMPGIIPGALVASLGSGLLLPSLVTWVVSAAEFADRGRVTGWWTAAFYFGQFLTPIVVAALTVALGGLPTVVGIAGVLAAIVGFGVAIALRPRTVAVTA